MYVRIANSAGEQIAASTVLEGGPILAPIAEFHVSSSESASTSQSKDSPASPERAALVALRRHTPIRLELETLADATAMPRSCLARQACQSAMTPRPAITARIRANARKRQTSRRVALKLLDRPASTWPDGPGSPG